jgi:hypothetical protein
MLTGPKPSIAVEHSCLSVQRDVPHRLKHYAKAIWAPAFSLVYWQPPRAILSQWLLSGVE